jgi:hypothetical protein
MVTAPCCFLASLLKRPCQRLNPVPPKFIDLLHPVNNPATFAAYTVPLGGVLMFDSIEQQPRGFCGRPLTALLFAVGTGCLASYVSSWIHSDLAGWIFLAIMMLIPIQLQRRDERKVRRQS